MGKGGAGRGGAGGEGNSAGIHQHGEGGRGGPTHSRTPFHRTSRPRSAPHPSLLLAPLPPPQVDEVLAQASAVSQNLADQRRLFDTIGDKVCV